MSATTKALFICTKCDAQSTKWSGRCLECGSWSTVTELASVPEAKKPVALTGRPGKTYSLSELKGSKTAHRSTGIAEFDRVLGGGVVPGSLVLLSGEPGIGKSTLLLQVASALPNVLYASGEESADQVALRFERLGLAAPSLKFLSETDITTILATIDAEKPSLVIIDSIQTLSSPEAAGAQGGATQIRALTAQLMDYAKKSGVPMLIVGQVTKDGDVAGPKTLEHLVDVVVSFEGDRSSNYRLLRTAKNRFGATDEVGVFEMTASGLKEVANPSSFFLNDRSKDVPGSVVTCIMEGTRPILVEIQALASRTTFGYPQRRASGFDANRLQVLLAVLSERLGVPTQTHDIHINVAGGYKVKEPAADAAVVLAVVSALKGKPLPASLAAFGEVGLGGELRPVTFVDKREAEAKRLQFSQVITPKNSPHLKDALAKLF
ncbi:MAG: DNA repair protein RadA [Patescibacteria group bacterium]|jgi:DNA repair protein RadA/Sms